MLAMAKIGILTASVLADAIGWTLLCTAPLAADGPDQRRS